MVSQRRLAQPLPSQFWDACLHRICAAGMRRVWPPEVEARAFPGEYGTAWLQLADRLCAMRPNLPVLFMSATPTAPSSCMACWSPAWRSCKNPSPPQCLARRVHQVLDGVRRGEVYSSAYTPEASVPTNSTPVSGLRAMPRKERLARPTL